MRSEQPPMPMPDPRISTIVELLERIAAQEGPGLQTLSVTDREVPAGVEVSFPVAGFQRWLLQRQAVGGRFAVTEAGVQLLIANNRRLGGMIVNNGAENIVLTLADLSTTTSQGGLGEIELLPGESWDLRLGSILWCGSVSAAAGGKEGTSASVVEV